MLSCLHFALYHLQGICYRCFTFAQEQWKWLKVPLASRADPYQFSQLFVVQKLTRYPKFVAKWQLKTSLVKRVVTRNCLSAASDSLPLLRMSYGSAPVLSPSLRAIWVLLFLHFLHSDRNSFCQTLSAIQSRPSAFLDLHRLSWCEYREGFPHLLTTAL